MAQTRNATGNSRPRILNPISTAPVTKRKTTTKKSTGTTATGRVTKKRAPNTHHKRKPTLKDKVEGAIEKAKGVIEGKPGKKAAGTRQMRGTDGKGARTTKKKKTTA